MKQHKVVLIGDQFVGKTCLYHRIGTNEFSDQYWPTVPGTFQAVDVLSQNDVRSQVGLWDTCGDERYKSVVPMYFEHAEIVLVVYSLTDRRSFESLQSWIDLAMIRAKTGARLLVIGNKSDDENSRQVSEDSVALFASGNKGYLCLEVSAKTGEKIDLLLSALGNACEELEAGTLAPGVRIADAKPAAGCC
jgi:small GTP-binding protein